MFKIKRINQTKSRNTIISKCVLIKVSHIANKTTTFNQIKLINLLGEINNAPSYKYTLLYAMPRYGFKMAHCSILINLLQSIPPINRFTIVNLIKTLIILKLNISSYPNYVQTILVES